MVISLSPAYTRASGDEIEWQFDAPDLSVAEGALRTAARLTGLALRGLPHEAIEDIYFDTADGRLRAAGWALRARRRGDRCEATLKSLRRAARGPQRRREINQPIDRPEATSVRTAPGPLGVRVRLLLSGHPLLPQLTVRTARGRLHVDGASRPIGEAALDETTFARIDNGDPTAGSAPRRVVRLELESIGTVDPQLARLADQLGACASLEPSRHSKFEAGLGELPVRSGPAAAPPAIDPSMPLPAFLRTILAAQAAEFVSHEQALREQASPQAVHRMRIASRRMSEALALFGRASGLGRRRLAKDLAWGRRVLGESRDLDVQIAGLEQEAATYPALAPLLAGLETARAHARRAAQAALDAPRFERLLTTLDQTIAELGSPDRERNGTASVGAVAPRLLKHRINAVRRRADRIRPHSPDADLHALRIRVKRLRYAFEFLAPLYPRPAARLLPRLVALQDGLGRHQDACVSVAQLQTLAASADPLPPATIFAMGELAARHRHRAVAERHAVAGLDASLRGKPWRGLRHALREGAKGAD